MDAREIARLRLRHQRLAGNPEADPVAVVARFGAMQAQEFAVARWSVGQRSARVTDAAVQQAFEDGLILRTHALRPTWHFIAATDLRWIQALTGPRVHAFNGYYNRQHGLDERTADRAAAVLVDALRGGSFRTRAELATALAESGLHATGNKLAYVIMRAELDGLIASGPMRGKQHTYALVEERAPVQIRLEGEAALAELTRRYFAGHGPATVKDFAWWSSLTLTQIRHGIALLRDELSTIEVDGLRYWFTESFSTVDGGRAPAAHVLQAYDEYVVGYTESRPVMNAAGVIIGLDTLIHPVIVDGQLAGFWQREVGRPGIVARLRRLLPLSARQERAVQVAFARYSAFAGVPVEVVPVP
jgi:hypothetical protein